MALQAQLNLGVNNASAALQIYNNTGNRLAWLPDTNIGITGALAGRSTATSGINTTETIVLVDAGMGTGIWQVGNTIHCVLWGTCTSSVANVSTFTLRAGTGGTTSDASIATATVTAAASGTSIPFYVDIVFTITATGTTGTIAGAMNLTNNGTTGIAAAATTVASLTATATLNTTSATAISLSYKSAATTTTTTFNGGYMALMRSL